VSERPAVTLLCATFDAREAVRLTFSSLRRYTADPCVVLVADNGSTDGTLEDLRAMPWLTVFSLEERRALVEAEIKRMRHAAAVLRPRLDCYAESLPARERALLDTLRTAAVGQAEEDGSAPREHGVALDWLARRVRTPFFLTLDSDVEFLEAEWLSDLLGLARRERLDAVGEYQPPMWGQQPRLAPYLLLLRTAAFRTLGASFRPVIRFADPEDARRWETRPAGPALDPDEIAAAYPSAAVYPVAAHVFERLKQAGAAWSDMPDSVAQKYLHLGHMSWAGDEAPDRPGAAQLMDHHAARLTYVRERLRLGDASHS
jgi:hypothetical protein